MTAPASTGPAVRPLDGILVVALEQAVAVPFATRQLADLGARVIKIERPGVGDFARSYDHAVRGQGSYFVWLNRGKESIELDVKDPDDRDVLDALLARADVFVANLGPGAIDRLGLDAATLRAARPELIHCTLSGYGTDGPYAGRKAYDLLVQCETGLLSVTGTPDQPVKVGASVADIAAGMYTYSGILTALLHRERAGEGATLEIAMIDALGEWMTQPALLAAFAAEPPGRTGAHHASIAPYGPYPCRDGTLFLAVQNDPEWVGLCREVLGRPELVDDPRFRRNPDRVRHRDALDRVLAEAFADRDTTELERSLDGARIAHARLRSAAELLTHPQLVARQRWGEIRIPGGATAPALLPPVTFAGRPAPLGDVPALGQHTEALRAEFSTRQRPPAC